MDFRIYRTSAWIHENPCCEESLEKNNGWFIEINSIGDLIELINKYGDLIMAKDDYNKSKGYTIEIYDDYRE